MSGAADPLGTGHKRPPASTRFRKGQSGNPKGRPKKSAASQASPFDIIIDRTLTITQGGMQREVSVDEALQHKTYQDAIAGSRAARREVLKMIAKREKALAGCAPPPKPPEVHYEPSDPANAEEAMLILGIAERDPRWTEPETEDRRLLLAPWAVQAALSRRGRKPLRDRDVSEVERCTRDAGTLHWPGGVKR